METILENLPFIAGAAVLVLFVVVFRLLISSGPREEGLKRASAVLENASVFVHAITPIEPPDTVDDEEEGAAARRYFSVDVTITPASAATMGAGPAKPSRWDPFALGTRDPDSDPDALEESCDLVDVTVWRGGQFVTEYDVLDQETEAEGAQRVRLRVGALPSARRFVFVYFLQEFGEVRLP